MTDPIDVSTDLAPPRRALAIGAHPDDVEFGCGATLAKWAAAGTEVHLAVLTDGSKGTWDPTAELPDLVARRAREQADAARVLGVRRVHHFGFVDGELANDVEARRAVSAVLRAVRPTVLLTHDPWKRYRLHPDHRTAGFLVLDAMVAARDPHFFADQLAAPGTTPHRPDALLLFEADAPDHGEYVPHLGTKTEALLRHRSQWRSTMGIDGDGSEAQIAAFTRRVEREAREAAGRLGLAAPVESFKLLTEL